MRCSRPSSSTCRPPQADADAPLQFQISTLDYNSYVGRIGIGRLRHGSVRPGQNVALRYGDEDRGTAKIGQVLTFTGLERMPVDEAFAGDIVAVTGIEDVNIGLTVCDPQSPVGLPPIRVDEPTIAMNFQVNTSPLAGREGKFVTSRQIRERLQRELQSNVALRVEDTGEPDVFRVQGRGELHLTILLENMRREGYELAVSRPQVLTKMVDGAVHEPYEALTVDIEEANQGAVMEALGDAPRRAHRHVHGRSRPRAPRIPRAGARAHRLPGRVHDAHARQRPHQPHLRRLRAGEGRDSRSAATACSSATSRARRWPMRCGTCRNAAACS